MSLEKEYFYLPNKSVDASTSDISILSFCVSLENGSEFFLSNKTKQNFKE